MTTTRKLQSVSAIVKDSVFFVNENGQIKRIGIKHLLFSIKEIYGMFRKENEDVRIGLSTLFNLKPAHVRSFAKMPHNICVCQIYENLRCGLKQLQKSSKLFTEIKTDNEMHLNFTCNEPTIECFEDKCQFCFGVFKFHFLEHEIEDPNQIISWFKWVKTDQEKKVDKNTNVYCNIEKVKKTGTISELLQEIYNQVPEFLDHEFIKINQAKSSHKLIGQSLIENSDSAVVIVDFAENFKCVQQNAPQSAHYGQTPISIFTIAVYHRGFHPKAIVSDKEKHSKEVVLAYMDKIFEGLPSTVSRVDVWSDNATSQFKNQFIINSIKTFEKRFKIKIVWNFFAAMHGKSVVDGIGGSLKRFVRDRIIAQDLQVNSAEDFVSFSQNIATETILMSSVEIEARNSVINLENIIKNSKKISDIKKNHCFELEEVQSGKKIMKKVALYKITP